MLSVFLIGAPYPAVVVQHLCVIEYPYCSATHPVVLHPNSVPCFLRTTKKSNLCAGPGELAAVSLSESSMPYPQMTIRASILNVCFNPKG